VGLGFSRGLAEQNALDEPRHFVSSFFPVDALDEGFNSGRLSVVHKAPPGTSYARGARTHPKRGPRQLSSSLKEATLSPLMLLEPRSFLLFTQHTIQLGYKIQQLVWVHFVTGLFGKTFPMG
jgi:hypothetical protein